LFAFECRDWFGLSRQIICGFIGDSKFAWINSRIADDVTGYEVGQEITTDILAAGDLIDVTAVSKGKGFAGTMKRHNFSGQKASHGTHRVHRKPGSVGACATPARVFKGTRMAGRMGGEQVTTLNLEVVEADAERGLLLVRGAVPGPNGSLVFVKNAAKRPVTPAAPGGAA